MENTVEIRHVSLEINADFERVTQKLEQSLGRFDNDILEELETDLRSVQKKGNQNENRNCNRWKPWSRQKHIPQSRSQGE